MHTATHPTDTDQRDPICAGQERRYWTLIVPNGLHKSSVLEVLIGMAVAMGLAYLLHPSDPLLIGYPYPWLWLLATIFALRYGALLGVLAGLCIIVAWWLFYSPALFSIPTLLFTGGMIQLVVVGHVSDIWMGRLRRLQSANDYLGDRLSSLMTNHYLLRASYEDMEQEMLGRHVTLRDAVADLRVAACASGEIDDFPGAQQLLEYAATVCRVDQAAIFRVTEGGVEASVLASVGSSFTLMPNDSLVLACLESHQLTHLRSPDTEHSAYIACVPIVSIEKGLIAMLVVRDMPFLALNADNLQLLRILSNYFVDGLSHAALVKSIQDHVPACPDEFALELGRVTRMMSEAEIPSTLMTLEFPLDAPLESVVDLLRDQRRTLDLIWVHASDQSSIVVMLLPLTDTSAAHDHSVYMQHQYQTQLGLDLERMNVCIKTASVPAQAPGLVLCRMLNRGHRD